MKMQEGATNQSYRLQHDQSPSGVVSAFNAPQPEHEDERSDYTERRVNQNQANILLKVASPAPSQNNSDHSRVIPASYGQHQFNHVRNTRFFSQRDVAQPMPDRKVLVTSTSPDDTLNFDPQHHSIRPRGNEISVLDESLNSEQERGDRILDLSPNFEGDKQSDERLSPEKCEEPF